MLGINATHLKEMKAAVLLGMVEMASLAVMATISPYCFYKNMDASVHMEID